MADSTSSKNDEEKCLVRVQGLNQRHRWAMISIFVGALVIAGLFTLVPGRIMHAVIFGP